MGYPLITFTAGDDIDPANNNTNFRKARDGRFELQANEAIDTTSGNPQPFQIADNGWIDICDANDLTKLDFVGFVLTGQNVAAGEFVEVMMGDGTIIDQFTGLTRGSKYYVQDDQTIGTAIGTAEIFVGWAISATEILIVKGSFEFISSVGDVADVITVPDGARFAIVAMTANDTGIGIEMASEVFLSAKGKTSGVIRSGGTIGASGDQNQVTASWNVGNKQITLSAGQETDAVAGNAKFYR